MTEGDDLPPRREGFTVVNGMLVFNDPIEFMMLEMRDGVNTVLVLTQTGVIRVPGGRCIRPRTLQWSDQNPQLNEGE